VLTLCVPCVSAVNPPNEDELFEAMTAGKVSKAQDLPLLIRTGEGHQQQQQQQPKQLCSS